MITELPAIERLVADLARRPEVLRIWLFGSRARGDQRPRSDIDLAVEAPRATEAEWNAIWTMVGDADTLLPIDCVRLEEAQEPLKDKIRSEGRILFER